VCHAYQRGGPYAPERRPASWSGRPTKPPHQVLAGRPPGEPLGLRRLVCLAKGRWRIEQDYRELKDELGSITSRAARAGVASPCDPGQYGVCVLVLERARAKKNLRADLAQIRRQLQQLLLRLGEWCPWCGSRLPYDTS